MYEDPEVGKILRCLRNRVQCGKNLVERQQVGAGGGVRNEVRGLGGDNRPGKEF